MMMFKFVLHFNNSMKFCAPQNSIDVTEFTRVKCQIYGMDLSRTL